MNKFCFLIGLCFFLSVQLNANPLYYPVPALAETYTGAYGEYSIALHRIASISIRLGQGMILSVFPPVEVPATAIEGGVSLQIGKKVSSNSGFAISAETKIRMVLNPIIFNEKIYEYDLLTGILPGFSLSYRIPLSDQWSIEPFAASYTAFYLCLTPLTQMRLYPTASFGLTALFAFKSNRYH